MSYNTNELYMITPTDNDHHREVKQDDMLMCRLTVKGRTIGVVGIYADGCTHCLNDIRIDKDNGPTVTRSSSGITTTVADYIEHGTSNRDVLNVVSAINARNLKDTIPNVAPRVLVPVMVNEDLDEVILEGREGFRVHMNEGRIKE